MNNDKKRLALMFAMGLTVGMLVASLAGLVLYEQRYANVVCISDEQLEKLYGFIEPVSGIGGRVSNFTINFSEWLDR